MMKEGVLTNKTWVGFVDTDRVADDDGEESSREELFATMDRVLEEPIINLSFMFGYGNTILILKSTE
ncbi:hypothetical protein RHMOL_Rhmol01G0115600 [Rhododendron molle]|uniref:Uncharacterized protein n=1 Tax=Rhododendron molle TaxID=49168 RepID=A0ACC0Q1T8_RHOML|nr:hypothetical protein RHMOL_Rhmol01G0115600 [Rhododendron molle]